MTDITQKNYERFAQAIILQAVKDYRAAMKTLRSERVSKERQFKAANTITEVRLFFRSNWFKDLCGLEPESLIKRLDAGF